MNRSFSIISSLSFFFIAPGLLLRLFFCIFAWLSTTSPSPTASSRPGSASASDSRFATSLLFGRLRFWTFEEDFSILLTKAECFIVRLSFLDEGNSAFKSSEGVGRVGCGRDARAGLARAEVRFLPETGACFRSLVIRLDWFRMLDSPYDRRGAKEKSTLALKVQSKI